MQEIIKIYPVGNGDQSILLLKDGTTIMVDCNIRKDSKGSTDPAIFDVKKDVLSLLKRKDGNPYTDVFILTHGDCDHCRGYKENFYQGNPKHYGKANRDADEIIIDEMWFSPMIAEEHTNSDEDAYQQEAERRLEMHRSDHTDKDLPGNRIRIIGYDGNKDYSTLNHLREVPGTVVKKFNSKVQDGFSLFIHAPFKEQLASADKNKNSTSIVFQARFKMNSSDNNFCVLAMFGGDADYIAWGIIYEKTVRYGKDKSEQALDWDLFLAPHHCSWTYFNETPYEENPDPQESSLEILRYKRKGGIVIASSKKIEDDDDNPPHYPAKEEYIKQLDSSSNFLNTGVEPTESAPEPIEFVITANGPVRSPGTKIGSAAGAAGGTGAASTIIKQG